MSRLKKHLLDHRGENKLTFYFDIETFQYNEEEGYEKPTKFKNMTYSVAVSYFTKKFQLEVLTFSNWKHFFDTIINTYKPWKNNPRVEMIAHNTNKYDNHFLRYDLIYYYDVKVENLYLKHAIKEGNQYTIKKTDVKESDKIKGLILEKRIKSSNNLELLFFLDGIEFFTTDNWLKTNSSLELIGRKLLNAGFITEQQTKTEIDHTKNNKRYDMTEERARRKAEEIYHNLNEDERTYIQNDVIILAYCVMHYSDIYYNFSYDRITYTSNILEFYNDNELTNYQLVKKYYKGSKYNHLKYTDYQFQNMNFYDYLKPFYKGGLNLYNSRYVGKILKEPMFAIDLKSSYSHAMYDYKIPTFLKDYQDYDELTKINIELSKDTFTLYKMRKIDFDAQVLINIESRILKEMLVKYYNDNDFIQINDNTIRIIRDIAGVDIQQLYVLSTVTFECFDFGSKEHISDMYKVKTQGSEKFKIIYRNPYDITRTNEPIEPLSREEVENSKVVLNGIYGIPALRPFFNLFRLIGSGYQNIENGYQNAERNIVFSIFVTSVALYNLLEPLKYLNHKEIDENFIYCDTDSLFLKKKILHKLPKHLFHDLHLGKWDFDDKHIEKMMVLNHKKYVYQSKKDGLVVKAAGIPSDAFNTNMSFEEFIYSQFQKGTKIKNLKSIYNEQGTISLYESVTEIDVGGGYLIYTNDKRVEQIRKKMMEEIKEETNGNTNDFLYIESTIGNFSLADLFPYKHEHKHKLPLLYMEVSENEVKNIIFDN